MTEANAACRSSSGELVLGRYLSGIRNMWRKSSSHSHDAPANAAFPPESSSQDGSTAPTNLDPDPDPSVVPVKHLSTPRLSSDRGSLRPSERSSYSTNRERSQAALFAKYGLEPPTSHWPGAPEPPRDRIERSIRMRIRYWCHHCNTIYGSERICGQCEHVRCNKCRRHPPKKATLKVRRAGMERRGGAASFQHISPALPPVEADGHTHASLSGHLPLASLIVEMDRDSITLPPDTAALAFLVPENSRVFPVTITPDTSMPLLRLPACTGGPEVLRPPKLQVIGRTCHECDTFVPTTAAKCSACDHPICIQCPRQPLRPPDPPTDNNDDDMPLDPESTSRLIMKKHGVRVHHICHQCSRTFEKGSRTCASCSHVRCGECPRDPPRKTRAAGKLSTSRAESALHMDSGFEAGEPGWQPTAIEVGEEQPNGSGEEWLHLTDNMSA